MIPTTERIHQVLARIETLLVEKNAAYGDSAMNPVRIFSRAAPTRAAEGPAERQSRSDGGRA